MALPPVVVGILVERALDYLWGLISKKERPKRKKKKKVKDDSIK